ncbi:MAG: SPOR domain-containing protein [Candidatus Omnitrophica bacterium]|nr:SPOR domain-containing protein [Candidatus Omnitrophota bacterium]
MPLFRKSKEEGLKPLSEKEIQERLYGFFHHERVVQISGVPKKSPHKSLDLKSIDVTPAGITQHELPSETQNSFNQENGYVNVIEEQMPFSQIRSDSFRELSEEPRKAIKKPVRKVKKDKKREEAVTKFFELVLEKVAVFFQFIFSACAQAFSRLAVWLGESRGESKRIPAKFILVSLAVIGTGLIFFNIWTSHVRQNPDLNVYKEMQKPASSAPQGISSQAVITKVIAVTGDALSDPSATTNQIAKKFFTIQVCTVPRLEGAIQVTKRLQSGGLPAFYESGTNKKGSHIYHVMIGKFDQYQTAKAQLAAIKSSKAMESYPDSYIRNIIEK